MRVLLFSSDPSFEADPFLGFFVVFLISVDLLVLSFSSVLSGSFRDGLLWGEGDVPLW